MRRRVRLRGAARRDLEEEAAFLASTSVAAALRFLGAAEGALARLAASPRIGRPRPFADPFLRGTRSWPVPGFEQILVFYRPVTGGIEILRVLHGARDLPAILEEE